MRRFSICDQCGEEMHPDFPHTCNDARTKSFNHWRERQGQKGRRYSICSVCGQDMIPGTHHVCHVDMDQVIQSLPSDPEVRPHAVMDMMLTYHPAVQSQSSFRTSHTHGESSLSSSSSSSRHSVVKQHIKSKSKTPSARLQPTPKTRGKTKP